MPSPTGTRQSGFVGCYPPFISLFECYRSHRFSHRFQSSSFSIRFSAIPIPFVGKHPVPQHILALAIDELPFTQGALVGKPKRFEESL